MPDPQTVLEGYFYVGMSLCSLHGFEFFFFLVAMFVFSMDVCHLFLQCMLAVISLIGYLTGVLVTKACPGY